MRARVRGCGWRRAGRPLRAALALAVLAPAGPVRRAVAQEARVGRDAVERITFPPLSFHAPTPEHRKVEGVDVLYLRDAAVPLTTVFARFKGGYARFPREQYAAGMALPSLLRYGGTRTLTPDSVDKVLEYYAIQTSFGGGGEAVSASLNTLSEHLARALDLFGRMLAEPRFDTAQVQMWRLRELESVRRRSDDPQRLAFSEFNRLMFGDHPVGWEMTPADVAPGHPGPEVLRTLHRRIVCRDHLILGVTSDGAWHDVAALLGDLVARIQPCGDSLPPSPIPRIRARPGVYVIPRTLKQSVVVMAHPAGVRLSESRDYFASRIGNLILGSGGFSSRILSRVRTEKGYAYSASSLWTTPRRYDGLIGAITRTRPEKVVPAVRSILDIMREMTREPPSREEVRHAIDETVNSFVFNFDTPARVVSRRMFYLAQDMPADWLERYVRGIERVGPSDVLGVFHRNLRPAEMTILVLGDTTRIGREALETLGPVQVWPVERGR